MSNIMIRKSSGGHVPSSSVEWEPLRMMRNLMSWDPFREMAPLRSEDRGQSFLPAFEVKETKDAFVFRADLPGIQDKDLEIQLVGNRLTVSGKREAEHEDKEDTFFVYERSYGSFVRSFTLPDGVDVEHIRAESKDGVLNLVLPKKPEAMPRKIAIRAGDKTRT
jgi:HSP20 family protein